ncbi:phospholipase D-like domain-containing protein [Tanticharoenia sakaeratensis]|uniref:Phospholipase D n=1 Tax=Tanticharoenia sakaeratensis NBRC 103193 TaxID=1231623 RepID=A0A0D6MP18_9PROT|nr:cardiolipin synthetase [Tanticharoenia sakaeratensis NBRC 103193]
MMHWLDSSSGYGLLAIRVALALVATLHILRTKDDTAAATGWIGVCWLMPFTGVVLYAMFGINRVRRLAQRIAERRTWEGDGGSGGPRRTIEGRLAPLARTVTKLTERPVMDGNTIAMMHNGDATYPRMIEAIDAAERTILLCSYIFRHDRVGTDFVAALSRAKARGCQIHVLVDGIGSGYFICGVERALRREGIDCRRFMHSVLPWRMPFINLRNHRKVLLIDGRIGFMGGLNIGEENLLRLRTKLPVCDTHFRVEGPILRQLTESFVQDWAMTTGTDLDGDTFFPDVAPLGDVPLRVVTSGPDNDLEKIEYAMLQGIALSRTHVRLMSPYFLPDQRFSTELRLAALRGVEIDIVVPGSSNHHLIDWARDANLTQFLNAGCRIWMARPPFNHSKLMAIDDDWCFVGSANLDVRSLRLNFEINLEVYDTAMTRDVSNFIDRHRHIRVTHHDLDKRPMPVKLRNAAVRLFMPYL